jgi:hypothetical protein
MIMEYISGTPVHEAWFTMSAEKKAQLVDDIADLHSRLYDRRFDTMGSLTNEPWSISGSATIGIMIVWLFFPALALFLGTWSGLSRLIARGHDPHLGAMVAHDMIAIDRCVHQGPYRDAQSWMRARIQDVINSLSRLEEKEKDEEDEEMIALAQRFSSLLPTLFPPEPSLSTMLVIPDLHEGNVLVNDRVQHHRTRLGGL